MRICFDKNLIFFTVNTEAAAAVAKETLENVELTVNLERQISEDFVAAKESKKAATIAAIKRNQEVLELKAKLSTCSSHVFTNFVNPNLRKKITKLSFVLICSKWIFR